MNDLSLNGIKVQISTTLWPHFSFRKYFCRRGSERDHKLQKRSSRFSPLATSPSSREKKTSPPHILRPVTRLPARLLLRHQLAPTPISTEEKFRGEGESLTIIATTLNVVQHLILIFYWNLNNLVHIALQLTGRIKIKARV